jgi:hypothetical protein
MDIFGANWKEHYNKIEANWRAKITEDDLVLIPGDISWGLKLEEAKPDLDWIDKLPGTKVLLRGNHDYWWSSLKQVAQILPPSLHVIQNNIFYWKNVCIGGSRLWDSWEYNFNKYIPYNENPASNKLTYQEKPDDPSQRDKIFERELIRLETSLKTLDQKADYRIAMTHYPPISADLKPSRASEILEEYNVNVCVFGHLHNVVHTHDPLFGTRNNVQYILTAADYLNFDPILLGGIAP